MVYALPDSDSEIACCTTQIDTLITFENKRGSRAVLRNALFSPHTAKIEFLVRFHDELSRLQASLLEAAGLVRASIHNCALCVLDRDTGWLRTVPENEARINHLEIEIDSLATRLVALNSPVASDMRLIIGALKINTDLERMGDLAVSFSERAALLVQFPQIEPPVRIPQMTALVEAMVENSIRSFVDRDPDLAHGVLVADDEIDRLRDELYESLTLRMEAGGPIVRPALGALFIARNLERIADHATNVAEAVIFMVRGVDVRHHNERL